MAQAQDLTISLSAEEATLFLEIGQAELPEANGAELKAWAEVIAKNGLRAELWRVKAQQVRAQEQVNRDTERDAFNSQWPETALPGAEPEPPEEPVV